MNSYNIIRTFALSLAFFSLNSYAYNNNSATSSDYQTLCAIYGDIANKSLSLSQKEEELAGTIQTKVPQFFDRIYAKLMYEPANMRYQLTKEYAKRRDNIEWECEAARGYYENDFYNDNDSTTRPDYQTLCGIYIDITKKDLELWEKEVEVLKSVHKKLPLFYNRAYAHIMNDSANRRYQLTKEYAKQADDIEWECEAAREYYENDFYTD